MSITTSRPSADEAGNPASRRRRAPSARILSPLAVIAVIGLCWPDGAHAWTPGTHVVLSERILGSLHLLVPAAADLLRDRRTQGWRASDVANAVPDAVEALFSGARA